MSMHPQPIPAIPEETIRVARAVLPKSNVFLRMRDELGTVCTDEDFRDLFPTRGQPAEAPWRLALVTLMQYAEGLTDRQAADAVCTRIDWKYVLSLELTDSGFDFAVLCEFRSRLLDQGAQERRLFDRLDRAVWGTRLDQGSWQAANRFDPRAGSRAHAALGSNALERPMRHALECCFARSRQSGGFRTWHPAWAERYEKRFSDFRLPKDEKKRTELAETIGAEGAGCSSRSAPKAVPPLVGVNWTAIETLRQVWVQQPPSSSPSAPRGVLTTELPPLSGLDFLPPMILRRPLQCKKSTAWTGYVRRVGADEILA